MIVSAAFALLAFNFTPSAGFVHGDTIPVAPAVDDVPVEATRDTTAATRTVALEPIAILPRGVPALALVPIATIAPLDTPRVRPRAVEVSDWYGRRLTIHRYLAYSVIPLFAAQYVAGNQLYHESASAPTWAKTTHRTVASTLVGVFGVNTVTGLWNLWDSRSVSEGRLLRTAHALTMLAADAGFTYAGAKLAREAETSAVKRRQHRDVALASIGLTVAGGLMMRIWNR